MGSHGQPVQHHVGHVPGQPGYVCKHVTSPNIARRFGHKLQEKPGAYQAATTYQYQSSQQGRGVVSYRARSSSWSREAVASYPSYVQGVASHGRSSYRSSISCGKDVSSYEVTTPSAGKKCEEIPRIFSHHHNIAKTYLRTFQ